MRTRFGLFFCTLGFLGLMLFAPLFLPVTEAFQRPPQTLTVDVQTPDAMRLIVRLKVPEPQLTLQQEGASTFIQVVLDGADIKHEPGMPALPRLSYLVGLPPEGNARVILRAADVETIALDAPPLPSLEPARQEAEWAPGRLARGTLARSILAAQPLWPASPVVLRDEAWVRSQRVARLEIAPVQYDARANTLRWYRSLEVEVLFDGVSPAQTSAASAQNTPFDQILAASLLNAEQAQAWRTSQPPVAAAQTMTSLGPRYKIEVNEDGIYRLTYADLVAAGFDPTGVDPHFFHMVHQDQDVAILVEGEADGQFDPGDAILFYGQRYVGDITNQEHYTSTNTYWLLVDDTPGLRMTTSDAAPSGSAQVVTSHETTATFDAANVYWSWHFADGGYTTPQETFFAEKIAINTFGTPVATRTYTLTLHAVADEPFSATLSASAIGYSTVGNRRAAYTVNGASPTISTTWMFRNRGTAQGQIPGSVLVHGVNSVQAVFTQLTTGADTIYFDDIVLTYRQALQADNDLLLFNGNGVGTWEYHVDGFSGSDIRVFDVTVPTTPILLTSTQQAPTPNGYHVAFERNHGPTQRFAAVGPTGYKQPLRVSYYEPPDLKSTTNGADYIVITHRAFMTQAQALAAYRAGQGLRTKVVDVEDLYNEFNDGRWGPAAIRNFLAYAYENWQAPPPAYVVLFGYGHWNGQGFDAYPHPTNFLPPNMTWADPWQGEVDSANRLVAVVGDDILPDMLVGRIVVSDSVGAWAVVSKTIAYEQAGWQPYQQRVTFVADNNDDAGNFMAFSESAIARITSTHAYYAVDRLYLDEYKAQGVCSSGKCAALTHDLTQTLTVSGTQFLSYVGHASVDRWAHEYLMDVETAEALQNGPRLPIVLSMDCLDGYYFYPGKMSLAQTFIQNPNGGAVATFSPTGLGVATGHAIMQEAMFDAMWRDGEWTLGQAALVGKLALYASGWSYDLIDTFTIYGDPALQIPTGFDVALSPASAAVTTYGGQNVAYTLVLTNAGHFTDTFDLSVSGNTWPTTVAPMSITLAPAVTTTLNVTVSVPLMPAAVSDTVTVRAQSRGDTSKYAETTLITNVLYRVFAPLIVR